MPDFTVNGKVIPDAAEHQAMSEFLVARADVLLEEICDALRDRGYEVSEPNAGQIRVDSLFGYRFTVTVAP